MCIDHLEVGKGAEDSGNDLVARGIQQLQRLCGSQAHGVCL